MIEQIELGKVYYLPVRVTEFNHEVGDEEPTVILESLSGRHRLVDFGKNIMNELVEIDLRIDQQKLVVPQFVADWYEEHKDNFYLKLHRLAWELIENLDEDDFVPEKAIDSDFKRWYHKTETAIQTLINMHQFGYTVEKEKVYQIIDKRLNATFSCLGYDIDGRAWFWGNKKFFLKNKGVRLAHTRQQLIDAGYEEVFENPNYEAEEVTE